MTSTLLALLVVVMLIHTSSVYAQNEEIESCSITRFDPNCSPSGWVSIILGDVTLTLVIGTLIYYLQKRTANKVSEAIAYIQKIIKQEEESKRRQAIFVTMSLKNYFSVILMTAGLMNQYLANAKTYEDVPVTIRDKQEYMAKMVNHSTDALSLATHILDPVLTEQILKFISMVEKTSPESGVGKGFPRYNEIKKEIANITAKLDACVNSEDKILK